MDRRWFVQQCGLTALLGATAGCLSDDSDPHTETVTVYNHLGRRTTISLQIRRSGKRVFAERASVLASESWDVSREFGPGTYELTIEASDGPSATKSWEVPETRVADRGLGIDVQQSGIEMLSWVD